MFLERLKIDMFFVVLCCRNELTDYKLKLCKGNVVYSFPVNVMVSIAPFCDFSSTV